MDVVALPPLSEHVEDQQCGINRQGNGSRIPNEYITQQMHLSLNSINEIENVSSDNRRYWIKLR